MSFESTLEKWLGKFGALNVETGRLRAEFGCHLGFGFAVPLFVHYLWGNDSFILALALWATYSVVKEVVIDGHLKRMRNGTETPTERKDFWTDLLSRLLPLVILSIIHAVRK